MKNNLEKKIRNKPISYDHIKIGFFHYFYDERSAGVNRVIQNNIKGLKIFYPNLEPVLIAEDFQKGIFEDYKKIKLNLNKKHYDSRLTLQEKKFLRARELKDNLIELQKEFQDGLVAENVLRGIDQSVTKGMRNFSEYTKIPVIYRNHDFFVDYPDDWISFLSGFNNVRDPFPTTKNTTQVALTSSTQNKIEGFYDGDVQVLRNSVVFDDFHNRSMKKAKELRTLFEEKGIVLPGEKIISYPVRIDKRKNVEEALFLTKDLMNISGEKYRLIVTATRDKDYPNFKDNFYQRAIENFAKENEIPCSLGEAYRFIDGKNFNIGDLYHASELALTTAVKEGFGYAYVEPFISGTPLIGRRIREVCEDFELNGMNFKNNLYDNSILKSGKNWELRLKRLNSILKDPFAMKQQSKKLDLPAMIEYSKKYLKQNARVIKNVYGNDVVAMDLVKMLKLPNYQNL